MNIQPYVLFFILLAIAYFDRKRKRKEEALSELGFTSCPSKSELSSAKISPAGVILLRKAGCL